MPSALDVKPRILEYNGQGRNIQMMKRTANNIPKDTCNFCLLFIFEYRFVEYKDKHSARIAAT